MKQLMSAAKSEQRIKGMRLWSLPVMVQRTVLNESSQRAPIYAQPLAEPDTITEVIEYGKVTTAAGLFNDGPMYYNVHVARKEFGRELGFYKVESHATARDVIRAGWRVEE
jgi:hypothetical protein